MKARWSRLVIVLALILGLCSIAYTQQSPGSKTAAPTSTIFQNVRIFDGKSASLSGPANVLVAGNKIVRISNSPIAAEPGVKTAVIAGDGRVLMPGLIDAHWHTMMAGQTEMVALMAGVGYLNLLAAKEAGETLLRGFTTVRDMAGPAFDLKRAIDQGLYPGPRIYPSGACISQTSGHGDFRMPFEIPRESGRLSHTEITGYAAIADSPDEVRMRVREQLRQGASQIKLAAGGGILSPTDPIDVAQYTEAEMRAAVEAADNWGTYVAVHAYTPRAVQTAIAAGVKCIEHGHLIDEATAKIMAAKGIWWSLQPFLNDEDANFPADPGLRAKQLEVIEGTETSYRLAKKYKIKTAWGTDFVFEPDINPHQNKRLAVLTRWYTPAEALKMATADNAELCAMSGPRNPYPGKLGVVEEGAYADLLLVDGNPLENIQLLSDPWKNFVVIMKNGVVYKNILTK